MQNNYKQASSYLWLTNDEKFILLVEKRERERERERKEKNGKSVPHE